MNPFLLCSFFLDLFRSNRSILARLLRWFSPEGEDVRIAASATDWMDLPVRTRPSFGVLRTGDQGQIHCHRRRRPRGGFGWGDGSDRRPPSADELERPVDGIPTERASWTWVSSLVTVFSVGASQVERKQLVPSQDKLYFSSQGN